MIPLAKEITTIGRKQADIILDDTRASALHCEVRLEGKNHILYDSGSTNGTFLNRQKVEGKIELVDQDVIEIGMTTLCYFADIRDFHGEVQEVTMSTKTKPQIECTQVTELTTTSRKIPNVDTHFKLVQGEATQKDFRFSKSIIILGRGEVDMAILDMDASRKHAMIEVLSPTVIFLRDLGSTNGTYVNGERVRTHRLKAGDIIQVGNTMLEFQLGDT